MKKQLKLIIGYVQSYEIKDFFRLLIRIVTFYWCQKVVFLFIPFCMLN